MGGAKHSSSPCPSLPPDPGFLPWHREFLNRLEVLMREADPTVTMLYWDWKTDPRTDLFTTDFMGESNGTVGDPLSFLQPNPPTLTRNVGSFEFAPDSDSTITNENDFKEFTRILEKGNIGSPFGSNNHNLAHVFIGGNGGNMSTPDTAAEDPFFFLLHGNVDRIWAQWQRNPNQPERLNAARTYGDSAGHPSITSTMPPWNGRGPNNLTNNGIAPWRDNPEQQAHKRPTHYSVVAPPVYDTAPLVIPVLQPNESCVIQIPWFPPNPADFDCFGDPGKFCLLARIETSATSPYGMTTLEETNLVRNTRNNNNIAWKNITIVENVDQLRFSSGIMVRNFSPTRTLFRFQFETPSTSTNSPFNTVGNIRLFAPPEFINEFTANGQGQGVALECSDDGSSPPYLAITGDPAYIDVPINANTNYPITIEFNLDETLLDQYHGQFSNDADRLPFEWDFRQIIPAQTPTIPETEIGGQRFEIDLSKFRLVKPKTEWAYSDAGTDLGTAWTGPLFDDSQWLRGRAPLGFGALQRTTVNGGSSNARHTVYFRKTFEAGNPSIYDDFQLCLQLDDGAVVYLNGQEIFRQNIPSFFAGDINFNTLATEDIIGLKEHIQWKVPFAHLPIVEGTNVIAVEVHQASADSDDMIFDLGLFANLGQGNLKPDIKILSPDAGGYFDPSAQINVLAEALDQDGVVQRVDLSIDGVFHDTRTQPPYSFTLNQLSLGSHLLTMTAVDNEGAISEESVRITIENNIPPNAKISILSGSGPFLVDESILIEAEILSSPSAPVQQVEFFLMNHALTFSAFEEGAPIFVDTNPPYQHTLDLNNLQPGMYMLSAVVRDQAGNAGSSGSVHFHVMAPTVILAGNDDNFAPPEDPASPSAALVSRILSANGNIKNFDDTSINRHVGHTFDNLTNVGSAQLEIRLKPSSSLTTNDNIALEFDTGSGLQSQRWSRRIGQDGSIPGVLSNAWDNSNYPNGATINLDLSALPQADGSTFNMIPAIGLNEFFDFRIADDTTVDFCRLTINPLAASFLGFNYAAFGDTTVNEITNGLQLNSATGNVGATIAFPDSTVDVSVDTQSNIGFNVPSFPLAVGAPTTWSASFNSNDITESDNNIISTFMFSADGAGNLSVQPVFSGFSPSATFVATVTENSVVVSQDNWLGSETAPLISLDGNLTTPGNIMIQSESTTTVTNDITTVYDWALETPLGNTISLRLIVTDSTGQPVVENVRQSLITFSAEGASLVNTNIDLEGIQQISGPSDPPSDPSDPPSDPGDHLCPVVPVFPIWAYPVLVSALIGLGIRKKIIK